MSPRKMARLLTARQRMALDFIGGFTARSGFPPSLREIGSAMGITSTNGVRCLLLTLERKGYINRRKHQSRGIEIVGRRSAEFASDPAEQTAASDSMRRIPIVGRVAAGTPLLAVENIEGDLAVDGDFFPYRDGFALRVQGKSMLNAGILDGDIVLARPNLPLETGSIVVAVIGEEATVKRYYPETDKIRLEPANPHFDPIIVERGTPGFSIVGRVVGLFRRY